MQLLKQKKDTIFAWSKDGIFGLINVSRIVERDEPL
jgi:hypothetical protein